MPNEEKKQRLLDLVKQAHEEELENIKRARRNARAQADAELESYQNEAFLELTREIGNM